MEVDMNIKTAGILVAAVVIGNVASNLLAMGFSAASKALSKDKTAPAPAIAPAANPAH